MWLECHLPDELPLPVSWDVVSSVTVEPTPSASLPSDFEWHMTRPLQICLGTGGQGRIM